MLPSDDAQTADRWADLAGEIGRRACHGSAHTTDPELAWLTSGWEDAKRIFDALGVAPPQFFANSGQMHVPDLGRVLDYGAGAGRVAMHLAQCADEVVAIDAAPALVMEMANMPGVTPVCVRDPEKVADFGTFDTIVSLHTMYSMTPDGMAHTVECLGRVLSLGGKMVLDIPYHAKPERSWHGDPDPLGLPGGFWVHQVATITGAADRGGVTVGWVPRPVRVLAWEELAVPYLWMFRKGT